MFSFCVIYNAQLSTVFQTVQVFDLEKDDIFVRWFLEIMRKYDFSTSHLLKFCEKSNFEMGKLVYFTSWKLFIFLSYVPVKIKSIKFSQISPVPHNPRVGETFPVLRGKVPQGRIMSALLMEMLFWTLREISNYSDCRNLVTSTEV